MSGQKSIVVGVVDSSHDAVNAVEMELSELGLEVVSEELIRHHDLRPFNHFGMRNLTEYDEATESEFDEVNVQTF